MMLCGVSRDAERTWGILIGVIWLVAGSYILPSQKTRPVEGENATVRVGPSSAWMSSVPVLASRAKNCTFWLAASLPGDNWKLPRRDGAVKGK